MASLKIGLTGGIASGKSYISDLFASKNIDIIDADKIARSLFTAGSPLLEDLKQKFGILIFDSKDNLDRKALGQIVFNSPEDLKWLNQLTHPEVANEINRQLSKVTSPYVILDIPLLIDQSGIIPAHLKNFIDKVLVIDVSLKNQISRLCNRDNISSSNAQAIISNQSTLEQKRNLADDTIDNNGEISALESQVELLHNQYIEISASQTK